MSAVIYICDAKIGVIVYVGTCTYEFINRDVDAGKREGGGGDVQQRLNSHKMAWCCEIILKDTLTCRAWLDAWIMERWYTKQTCQASKQTGMRWDAAWRLHLHFWRKEVFEFNNPLRHI